MYIKKPSVISSELYQPLTLSSIWCTPCLASWCNVKVGQQHSSSPVTWLTYFLQRFGAVFCSGHGEMIFHGSRQNVECRDWDNYTAQREKEYVNDLFISLLLYLCLNKLLQSQVINLYLCSISTECTFIISVIRLASVWLVKTISWTYFGIFDAVKYQNSSFSSLRLWQ